MTSVQFGSSTPDAGAAPELDAVLALVEGSGERAGTLLARDVRTWIASPAQGLIAGIDAVRGADASAAALADLSPSSLTLVAAAVTNRACWAEVTRRADGEAETCLVGLSYDAGGSVSRLVWLRAPVVPASSEVDEQSAGPDGRPVLERYLADLMDSKFGEAASHFTVDTIYSHPPYAGGTERVLFGGREALWRGFVTERGPSPVRQIVTAFCQRGARVFVEGVIEASPTAARSSRRVRSVQRARLRGTSRSTVPRAFPTDTAQGLRTKSN